MLYYYFASLGGDISANTVLGYRYNEGITLNKSCETAASYYRVVAHYISKMYLEGNVVISEKQKFNNNERLHSKSEENDMFYFIEYRAKMGDKTAQFTIGQFYYFGARGAPKNYKKALEYFTLASKVF